jgi:hypothetical protein
MGALQQGQLAGSWSYAGAVPGEKVGAADDEVVVARFFRHHLLRHAIWNVWLQGKVVLLFLPFCKTSKHIGQLSSSSLERMFFSSSTIIILFC